MNIEIGQIVKSKAGHDNMEYYIVAAVNDQKLLLVNGVNRTMENPKVKNIYHVQPTKSVNKTVAEKIISANIINEEIKRAIKEYKLGNC